MKAEIQIEKWTAEERDLQVKSQEPVQVALRLLNYPAWQTEVNGRVTPPERSSPFNQMVQQAPSGQSTNPRDVQTHSGPPCWLLVIRREYLHPGNGPARRKKRTAWHSGCQILEEPAHNPGDSAAA